VTGPDYAALAAKAQADHTAANERYWQAKRDSEIAAFSELVFHAAAAGVVTVELEPSDQGDWMTVVDFTDAEGKQPEDAGLESALDDGAMDLQDYSEAHWTMLPGVTYESSKRTTDRATIEIPEAAQGLLDLETERDTRQKHIESICEQAGLGVMVQVYEIVCDREDTPDAKILALTADDVSLHYSLFVAPAIDSVERDIND
jgi:hypothetical protein